MDTSAILILLFIVFIVLLMCGLGFGVCILSNWAVNYPKRKAINAQKTRSAALTNAMADLTLALTVPALTAVPGIGPEQYKNLYELLPLYPIVSVLSAQGHVGPLQQTWLQSYLTDARFNPYQLEQLAVRREGRWEEWQRLAALGEYLEKCGEIWHTLPELLCRTRRPDLLQPITDALGAVTFHFHCLDYPTDSGLPEACFHRMTESFNAVSDADGIQATPYFHTFMLLQNKLAEQCGGAPEDWCPVPEGEGETDGRPCLAYSVCKRQDLTFAGYFLVAKVSGGSDSDDKDAIWKQTECGWESFYREASV